MELSEIRLGPLGSTNGLSIAAQELADKENEVIRALLELAARRIVWNDVEEKPQVFPPDLSLIPAAGEEAGNNVLWINIEGKPTNLAEFGLIDEVRSIVIARLLDSLSAHSLDTTGVHGITDTAALVLTDDPRLSDNRTPTEHAPAHHEDGTDPLDLNSIAGSLSGDKIIGEIDSSLIHTPSASSGSLAVIASDGTFTYLAVGAAGTVLRGGGSPIYGSLSVGDIGGFAAGVQAVPAIPVTNLSGVLTVAQQHAQTAYLNTSPTFTGGSLKISSTTAPFLELDGPAGNVKDLRFDDGGLPMWLFRADNTAKTGGNAGTDFSIFARTDAGGALSQPLSIKRSTGAVGLGGIAPTSINAAAQLQVDSTTRGFLPPRMTTTQRDAISSPPEGLEIYNTTLHKKQIRTASAWETVTST